MPTFPREPVPDTTLAFGLDPYGYVARRCRHHGSDVFETRLLGKRTLCMTGPEAAALFYDPARFQRTGAAPLRVQWTLFGRGGIQATDDAVHRGRKTMFLSVAGPEAARRMGDAFVHAWREALPGWASAGRVTLYDAMHPVLTRAVWEWAGLPMPAEGLGDRESQLRAMFDAAGAVGPRHWHSRLSRAKAEAWAAGLVRDARAGRVDLPEESPAQAVCAHREPDGALLTPRIAAVELLNLLRPTVALSVYVTFLAHALHEHPAYRDRVAGDPLLAEWFVLEVRRLYPIFPATVALVRDDFDWKGYRFERGTRVMLDLHGTGRDARAWADPTRFNPERFSGWRGDPYTLIPQGGGDHLVNHRCPGEWITIEVMKRALGVLTGGMSYEVDPDQDLRLTRRRLPAIPRDGFVIRGVQPVDGPAWQRPEPAEVVTLPRCPVPHGARTP